MNCCTRDPSFVPYRRSSLGALGTSPLVGTVVSKGAALGVGTAAGSVIGTAAGTAGGALFGAAAGSVVPVIGTVIGAVVGILTQKLFGHANYAAVYANIANVAALFNAYTQVAGQYVGRAYGWPELQYIWHGAMVSGLFPGNGPPAGQACTQAMIAKKINACGTGQWIDDLLGTSKPTAPNANNIAGLIGAGLAQGITDPVTMTNNVLVPGIEAIAARKNNGWISVSRSANPALYRQLLMDTADYMMSVANPNMPAYYGTQGIQPAASAAAPAAPAPAQTSAQQIAAMVQQATYGAAPPATTTPAAAAFVPMPPPTSAVPAAATVAPAPVATAALTPTGTTAAGTAIVPPDQTAALIAAMQAQGASQAQAIQAALASLQANNVPITPQVQAQVAQAAATPAASPSAPSVLTGGISGSGSAWILGGMAVLAVMFATARPKKSNLGRARRRR